MTISLTCIACAAELRVRDEHAGKAVRCPKCSEVITVPNEELHVATLVEPSDTAITAITARRAGTARPESTREPQPRCRRCGERNPSEKEQCRRCGLWLDSGRSHGRHGRPTDYEPCPRCRCDDPERVTWTIWGSFYGPAMFHHVRCRDCGYTYNGHTGKSNVLVATIFVLVPVVLIAAIIGGLGYYLSSVL